MIAIKLLPILQVIVILGLPEIFAYPVYGTKRYGRTSSNHPVSAGWPMPISYQQMPRNQRYAVNYYDMYPYSQSYPDDYYYPQESLSYPLYYPARTSKYEVYQAVLPYYYTDTPVPRLRYGSYNGYATNKDPLVDLEEEVLEEEREERDEPTTTGKEMYYENENDDLDGENLDDVNAAFLQNLIMTEMYKNAMSRQNYYNKPYPAIATESDASNEDSYGKWEEYPTDVHSRYRQEDEDVRELKELSQLHHHKDEDVRPTNVDRASLFHQGKTNKQNKKTNTKNDNYWRMYEDKRNYYPRPLAEHMSKQDGGSSSTSTGTSTTTVAPTTTLQPVRFETRGQKEEVLMRPATPVRHPFSDLSMIVDGERKRTPSVYDTIKHMLEMEKSLDKQQYRSSDMKPVMKKRIVSSEDSLTQQLSLLKKTL